MASQPYEQQKRKLNHSKKAVERAARAIRHQCDLEQREEAIKIIQNYREYHLYPLMLIKNHLARTAKKVDTSAIVVRRLKRLPTIINKLERRTLDGINPNTIQLTSMQDIGGCRVIVKNLEKLKQLHEKLNKSKSVHRIRKTNDYLKPKESGYGGIHITYNCFENYKQEHEWKNTRIEVQLRTELQHNWATSLEIIDTIKNVQLKTSMDGHKDWRAFFSAAGKLVAHKEKAYILTNEELYEEQLTLARLQKNLNVIETLAQYTVAISHVNTNSLPKKVKNHQGMCLVELKEFKSTSETSLTLFDKNKMPQALEALAISEKNNHQISVLLSFAETKILKKAYPNYFGSTTQFSTFIIKQILSYKTKQSKKLEYAKIEMAKINDELKRYKDNGEEMDVERKKILTEKVQEFKNTAEEFE